jgi:ribosomal protein L37AE/L43A
VKDSSLASRLSSLVCPLCEAGELRSSGHNSMCCQLCGGHLSGPMLQTLWQIVALPDASGSHACECGHPEMRRLSDGIYHYPACRSEILYLKVSGEPKPHEPGEVNQADGLVGGHQKTRERRG